MPNGIQILEERLRSKFQEALDSLIVAFDEVTIEVPPLRVREVCRRLRDDAELGFAYLIDLAGIDYAEYGKGTHGKGGLVAEDVVQYPGAPEQEWEGPRFAVVYHLLSYVHNWRLRLRTFIEDEEMPTVDSVVDIWPAANWFEREAFDLFGIIFDGHPDLRRILTDYGFVGNPMRKDFPLVGHVEMRYDPERQRVVYQPVSIENRVLVPKVIRQDHRYLIESNTSEQKQSDGNS